MNKVNFSTFSAVRQGNIQSERERGTANPPKFGKFRGLAELNRFRRRKIPVWTRPARPGAIFARFAGNGAAATRVRLSAWPAPRSPESAQGANSPNARTRARRVQPYTERQGKFFSPARPNLAGSGESGADAPVLRRGLGAQRYIFCDKSRKTVTVRVGQSALAAFHQVTTNPAAATLQLP